MTEYHVEIISRPRQSFENSFLHILHIKDEERLPIISCSHLPEIGFFWYLPVRLEAFQVGWDRDPNEILIDAEKADLCLEAMSASSESPELIAKFRDSFIENFV